ncbi:MAG: class I SAM-dependent methyltransferase [Hyphomicrobiales bacterium]|nr:class I SAM-dependent methyltransferase [Hyphomicrobiales bacterium]
MQHYKADVLGQFFTPPDIVKKMIGLRKNKGSILEPSAGDGAFISQLEKSAVGIEIDTDIDRKDSRVINLDFFEYSTENNFDTIIGNPPYVRFQDIADSTKALLSMEKFDKRSNLYLFFIEKCMRHLEKKGEVIFITPRDFLKTTSAKLMNEALYDEGSMTHFYDLGDARIFEDASPNCAIWRWELGRKDRRMKTGGRFHCKNGQIWFWDSDSNETLGDYFDVKVGAVSGADDVYTNKKGNVDMVCSHTRSTKETRRMIYNKKRKCLEPHKTRLMSRKIRKFDESNWWEWGRGYCQRPGNRIYVNAKTRTANPFYVSDVEAYDGSVLALFPKNGISCTQAEKKLNKVDWEKLGFVCDGRMQFTQRSLANAPFGM